MCIRTHLVKIMILYNCLKIESAIESSRSFITSCFHSCQEWTNQEKCIMCLCKHTILHKGLGIDQKLSFYFLKLIHNLNFRTKVCPYRTTNVFTWSGAESLPPEATKTINL